MEFRPTPIHPIQCGFRAYQQIPEKAPAPDIHGHSRASCQSPHVWSAVLRSLMVIDHPRVIRYGLLDPGVQELSYNIIRVHQPRLVVETLGLFMPCRMVQKCRQEEETLRITGIKSPWAIQLDVGTEFHEAISKHKCFFGGNQVTKLRLATPHRWKRFVI